MHLYVKLIPSSPSLTLISIAPETHTLQQLSEPQEGISKLVGSYLNASITICTKSLNFKTLPRCICYSSNGDLQFSLEQTGLLALVQFNPSVLAKIAAITELLLAHCKHRAHDLVFLRIFLLAELSVTEKACSSTCIGWCGGLGIQTFVLLSCCHCEHQVFPFQKSGLLQQPSNTHITQYSKQ